MTMALMMRQLPAIPTVSISELLLLTTEAAPCPDASDIPVAVRLRSVTPDSVSALLPAAASNPPPYAGD